MWKTSKGQWKNQSWSWMPARKKKSRTTYYGFHLNDHNNHNQFPPAKTNFHMVLYFINLTCKFLQKSHPMIAAPTKKNVIPRMKPELMWHCIGLQIRTNTSIARAKNNKTNVKRVNLWLWLKLLKPILNFLKPGRK